MSENEKGKSDFFQKVYQVVEHIPYGRVTTYGAIARHIGVASAARTVGYALNATITSSDRPIPAHRVVNRLGELTGRGHFPGDTMRERLRQEGVPFVDDYQVDIEQCFWAPGVGGQDEQDFRD